ncbi:GGDEF domain-containing protein [Roseibium sp. CAU 1637]|uniref:diguanylate cyclase n=1 Tax=Roseibium limicola TaxID=2816037 RepID=A0A939EMF3_9HYPH|nr:GGDEF domain-containing protein [Roseibium limicola]MBO0345118.1 GGDEF domain-containing protein [Roseibium limicola]
MTLDTTTLFASVTIANFAGALIICAFAAVLKPMAQETRRSCMMWCAAISLVGVGCILIGLRGQISDTHSIIVGNALLLSGQFLKPSAITLFHRNRIKFLSLPVIVTGSWLLLCLQPFFEPSLLVRVAFVQGLMILGNLISIRMVHKGNREQMITPRLLIVTLLLEIAASALFSIYHANQPFDDLMGSFGTTTTTIYMGLVLVAMMLKTVLIPAMALEWMQVKFRKDAWQDPLTGLANRRAFEREARDILARQGQCNQPHALIVLDIDDLNEANQQFGSPMGDALLRLLAKICRQAAPDSSLIGRIGDDEFALLLPEANQSKAQALAAQICHTMKFEAARASNNRLRVTISAGIYWGWSGLPLSEVMEIANSCLRKAKRIGPGLTITNHDTSKVSSKPRRLLSPFTTRRVDAA